MRKCALGSDDVNRCFILFPFCVPSAPMLDKECGLYAILCTGGLDVIRKEAWSFYRTSSGVRLCWELEEPEGPKGLQGYLAHQNVPPLGPHSSPIRRALGWSWGGGAVSYKRGTPVEVPPRCAKRSPSEVDFVAISSSQGNRCDASREYTCAFLSGHLVFSDTGLVSRKKARGSC